MSNTAVTLDGSKNLFSFCKKEMQKIQGKRLKDHVFVELLSISATDVSLWKAGKKKITNIEHYLKLAEATQTNINDLYEISTK